MALLLSGGAGLIYQSTWGRMLQRVFGVSDLANATVLATFFLGLGLGSALAGRWARKLGRPALAYAALEVVIGIWALLSLLLVPNVHHLYASVGQDAGFGLLTTIRFLLAVLILLPPTLLMGATLPVLIAAVARRGVDWSRGATWLYATNTLGAVLGAGISGLYLLPKYGTQFSVILAALGSFGAAVVVLVVWRRRRDDPADEPKPERPIARVTPQVKLAMLLAAVAGFASLAGEVLWTRVLRMVVQGTTQAFAAMLVNYLLGIALGSILAERLVKRYDARWLFGVTQLLLGLLTAVALWMGSQTPRLLILIQESTWLVPHDATVILAVSAFILFPLALVLGTSIPLAWKIAGGTAEEAEQHSGRVLAANTLGGLLGSLVAGFLLVPGFSRLLADDHPAELRTTGIELSILCVLFVHVGLALLALESWARRRGWSTRAIAMLVPVCLGAAVVSIRPSLHVPYLLDAWYDPDQALLYGPDDTWRDTVVFLREGRNTTVSILDRDGTLRLFNDGRPESGIGQDDPGFGEELAVLGSLPTIFAEKHDRAMVIGLGAGHTTAVLTGGPWQRIDAVELESAVVDAARYLYDSRDKVFPIDEENVHLVVDDARAQLVLAEEDSYDAVVSQPSHPWLAGSSALYTQEFFQEVDRALAPGGVLALWTNLFRMDIPHLRSIVRTLLSVFDHVHAYVVESSSFILVASNSELRIDARMGERVAAEGLRPYLQPFALDDLVDFAAGLELDTGGCRIFAGNAPLIRDDRPALEFDLARIPHRNAISESQLDHALLPLPWMHEETFAHVPEEMRADLFVQRVQFAELRWRAHQRVRTALDMLSFNDADRAYVTGVLEEHRGDLRGALTQYDRFPRDGRLMHRADDLRNKEGLYGQLLQSLEVPGRALPASAEPFLRAALARENRRGAEIALAVADRVDSARDDGLAAVTRAWMAGDCAALIDAVELHPRALEDPFATVMGMECATAANDEDHFYEFMQQRYRAERVRASRDARDGEEANGQGAFGYAMRYFRRALRHNPGHATAAASLARLLDRGGRTDEAEQVLRECYHAARGLPSATQALEDAASEIGVIL